FTASPTNGGTAPTFQWNINGANVPSQISSTFVTVSLANGDAVTVAMTSNNPCANPATAISNAVNMTVSPAVPGIRYQNVTATPNPSLPLHEKSLKNIYF